MKYVTAPNVMMFVGALLVALGTLWNAYRQNKEKDNQNQAKSEATKSQQRTEKGIEELLKTDELRPDRLRLQYPFGFVIFEIEHSQRVIPHQKQLPEGYDIDLRDEVSFADFPPDQISVTMPQFRIKDENQGPFNILPKVTLPKKVGAVSCMTLAPKGNFEEAFSQCAQILQMNNFGIVFLVGVKPFPLPPGYKPKTSSAHSP